MRRQSLTGGAALPVALDQLLHPADQLLPHVVKQQVQDGLTAAAVRRDGRETARPASRLGAVLLTLVVPGGNRRHQSNERGQGTEQMDFWGCFSQVSAVESQIFLHQTLRFNHGGLLLTGNTAASRTSVQLCRGRLAQLRPPALHVQPSRQHSGARS